jgi:hypothetical protein
MEKVGQQAAEILLQRLQPEPGANGGLQTTRRSLRTRSRPQ